MAIDTLQMTKFFEVCRSVLEQELRPIHYAALTEKALTKLGLTRRDVNWSRQIEDVREKMLLAGRYETFYTGAPHCLAGFRWWFEGDQLRLLNPSKGIEIPGSASDGVNGAFEALMRSPDMKIKTNAPTEWVMKSRASGLVIEKHVASWFEQNWPEFYRSPDNNGQWSLVCDHDFKLEINGKVYKVDVTGKRLNGNYGNPGAGKKTIDFHLLCEVVGRNVLWRSVYLGRNYKNIISPEGQLFGGMWPERMVVWLNCLRDNIDYTAIKETFRQIAA